MVQLAPNVAAGYRALAKFYLNTKRQSARARELAMAAVKLEPVADSYFVLGWASASNNKLSEARAALSRAIKLDPDNKTYRQLYELVQKRASNSNGKR
jgi:tetratricopeptide (TPR) repeat protein